MAIIEYILPTQPTGSEGGATFYKNGGQIAMRSRSKPVMARSNPRTLALNSITVLSDLWEFITNSDRAGWGAYAYNTPLTDAWGNVRYIRGYAHFMRSNRPRYLFGLPLILTPPNAAAGRPTFTTPRLVQAYGSGGVAIAFTRADVWASEPGAFLLSWISYPINPTRGRPPEIYRPLATLPGASPAPGTPAQISLPAGVVLEGSAIYTRWSVTRADGTLSGA